MQVGLRDYIKTLYLELTAIGEEASERTSRTLVVPGENRGQSPLPWDKPGGVEPSVQVEPPEQVAPPPGRVTKTRGSTFKAFLKFGAVVLIIYLARQCASTTPPPPPPPPPPTPQVDSVSNFTIISALVAKSVDTTGNPLGASATFRGPTTSLAGFVSFKKGKIGQDQVLLTLQGASSTRQCKATIQYAAGSIWCPWTQVGVGNYTFEVRVNGKLQQEQSIAVK